MLAKMDLSRLRPVFGSTPRPELTTEGRIRWFPSMSALRVSDVLWPAAGFVDTEIRCLAELESGNAEKKIQPGVQA